ncbi:MAG: PTS system nitrogen regulatory IIA component [Elusimicrobia bacterium]|nr:MAG: PTS system nitrogen regulatory IIA component [Elusimicrobiota bacterium]KAF0153840.1 MAG: PTS system nitrogen regulatory IIA component [Elusimicrobiota bacterium]
MMKQQDSATLASLLSYDNIFYLEGPCDRPGLVAFLASKLHPRVAEVIGEKALVDRLNEVEKLNNVLETGLYIPHAKLPDLPDFHAAMAVIPAGLKDPASPYAVRAAVLLLSPGKPPFFQQHLNMLASMARTFQTPFIDKLCALRSPAEAAALFSSGKP